MIYDYDFEDRVRKESHLALLEHNEWYNRAFYIMKRSGMARGGIFALIEIKMDDMVEADYDEMAEALADEIAERNDPYGYRGLSRSMFV
jgi:hypothetical protein